MKMITVHGSHFDSEEIKAVSDVINSNWVGMGQKTQEFEEALENKVGAPVAVVNSGSAALDIAIKLLRLPKDSEVIVPAYTWNFCATAIMLNNLRPIFCDVEYDTGNISFDSVKKLITKNTSAIMIVHYAGLPVDVEMFKSFELPIIEDAAHAIDSKIKGLSCGTIGDVGIYSFDAVKNLATPDAGAVVSRDENFISKVKTIRYGGVKKSSFEGRKSEQEWWIVEQDDVSPKYIPNDISSAIGIVQLNKIDKLQKRRKEVWDIYSKELKSLDWMKLPAELIESETLKHSYFTYQIKVLNNKRNELAQYLLENKIFTTLKYYPLNLVNVFNQNVSNDLPNTYKLMHEALNLPLHPRLTDEEIYSIVEKIKEFA